MPSPLLELADFVSRFAAQNPDYSKDELAADVAKQFGLVRERSVYAGPSFSVRFSTASGRSFSNTVLSLAVLQRYDGLPFIVCVARPDDAELLLANSTFIRKLSHSSHRLRTDNIRGSFLGHDILRSYGGVANIPENFDRLFTVHSAIPWETNVERIVHETLAIAPTGQRFAVSAEERRMILEAPELAARLSTYGQYAAIEDELSVAVQSRREAILRIAATPNVNRRGNLIEQQITDAIARHGIEDVQFAIEGGISLLVDVKTKLLGSNSNPKGYNLDKLLRSLAPGRICMSFFVIGIDRAAASLSVRLVSVLDKTILQATRIQPHWAGRNSRGVTQLTGHFADVLSHGFKESIDVPLARAWLEAAIDIEQHA